MPNHVQNIIYLQGDTQKINALMEIIQNDEYGIGTIDFNKIIPMPESLNIEAGSSTDNGLKLYREFLKKLISNKRAKDTIKALENIPKGSEDAFLKIRAESGNAVNLNEWNLGKTAWQNIQKYDAPTWYEWRIRNWGTKWNAYGYEEKEGHSPNQELKFQTAWDAPYPILQKLSAMYPEVVFKHEWADEDLGHNCGRQIYIRGKLAEEYLPEGVYATDFALDIWGYDPSDLDMVKNSAGTGYIHTEYDEYELAELFGKHVLFTEENLTAEDIPQGMYCYHLSKAMQNGPFSSIDLKASENHGGSIMTAEPINFGKKDRILFTDSMQPKFLCRKLSLREYMCSEPEEKTVEIKNVELQ